MSFFFNFFLMNTFIFFPIFIFHQYPLSGVSIPRSSPDKYFCINKSLCSFSFTPQLRHLFKKLQYLETSSDLSIPKLVYLEQYPTRLAASALVSPTMIKNCRLHFCEFDNLFLSSILSLATVNTACAFTRSNVIFSSLKLSSKIF